MISFKFLLSLLISLSCLIVTPSFAAREKFGADQRREEIKKELRTIKPSTEEFKLRW